MSDQPNPEIVRPVAFMVMPFRKRRVEPRPEGAPAEIDCDALWDTAFRPALETLGYLPIRADSELGSVMVKDMLERLALADLVLADLTLPNGNVYYEVGMNLDLNAYYCVSNLPGLLRSRGNEGDEKEAAYLDMLTVRSCERTIESGMDDGWAKPTLLGAAFRARDLKRVKQLALEIAKQGAAEWQLETTLKDVDDTIAHIEEGTVKTQLGQVRDQLSKLV